MIESATPSAWLHPPGTPAPGAPKGLVDLFVSPAQEAATGGAESVSAIQAHGGLLLVLGLILVALLTLGWLLWRYRRPLLLRWRLTRLLRLLAGSPSTRPSSERIAEALMWSLRRYFGVDALGLDRRFLPPRWRTSVTTLDAIRFRATAGRDHEAELSELLVELRRMPLQRHEALAPKPRGREVD